MSDFEALIKEYENCCFVTKNNKPINEAAVNFAKSVGYDPFHIGFEAAYGWYIGWTLCIESLKNIQNQNSVSNEQELMSTIIMHAILRGLDSISLEVDEIASNEWRDELVTSGKKTEMNIGQHVTEKLEFRAAMYQIVKPEYHEILRKSILEHDASEVES